MNIHGCEGRSGRAHLYLWLGVFAYAALAALFVQLILLPLLFPAWNAGDGMLAGGDWPWFHQLAKDLAEKIRAEGWSAWVLRPSGQAPAGIAAAIYAVTVPKPWTLIPLNAALHATGAVLLMLILRRFTVDWRAAALGAAPFALYPSAMTWYTQIHKDGYAIAGYLATLYGLVLLVDGTTWNRSAGRICAVMAMFLTGGVLVWVVRPYAVLVFQIALAPIALVVVIAYARRAARSVWPWRKAAQASVLLLGLVAALWPLARGGQRKASLDVASEGQTSTSLSTGIPWTPTLWLPARLDAVLYSVALTRRHFIEGYPEARSNVDTDVEFGQAGDVFAYLPRTVALAFLSPFPADWVGEGSLPANTVMRRISAFEMIGTYLALLLLPYAIWHWRKRLELWVVLAVCTAMMISYGLVMVNLGTLYRMRFPFLMTVVGLGLAAGASLWQERRLKKSLPAPTAES